MAKRMRISEFVDEGYLQEVNRQFLHPLGLALEIQEQLDGSRTLSGIRDYREDPEGVIFEDAPNVEKAAKIDSLRYFASIARLTGLGYIVQPVGPDPESKLTAIREQVAYGFTGETIKNMVSGMSGPQMNEWWIQRLNDILES